MKTQRQNKILEIINANDIETQEQLLSALQAEGFYCTQATISRDIKQLCIIKELNARGTYRYTAAAAAEPGAFSVKINKIFRESVISYDFAQNIVVIRTMAGLAPAAGRAIDAMNMAVVLGTIAGDDTLLIVMRDQQAAENFCTEIKKLLS